MKDGQFHLQRGKPGKHTKTKSNGRFTHATYLRDETRMLGYVNKLFQVMNCFK